MPRARPFHLLCCIGYTLLCLVWRTIAGRFLTWDHLNYHLYVAHAWWHNRLPEELFAAGPQSYLNPLPHLPFYAVFQTGAHSLVIALSMALLHSVNLWLLHFIACRLIPPTDRMRRLTVVCSVLLGALSPAFLFEAGTSYVDVVVSIPALSALLLLLVWKERSHETIPGWRFLYGAGMLAGIAMGLKPSSLVFCATLATALVLLSGRQAWSVVWRATLSGTAGLALSGGPHAWMLWKAFGNPVFPLFNGLFRSPWFPPVTVVSERFRPANLEAALRFPLDMANSIKHVSFESVAVDIRPLWLLGLLACAMLVASLRRFRPSRTDKPAHDGRRLFWLSLALFMPAWIYSSGNIRYAIEGLLLLGPAIGLLALSLVGKRHILAMLAILLPLVGQTVLDTTLNDLRKPSFQLKKDWPSEWFDRSVVAPLNKAPAYYLGMQNNSFASLAPVLPENSRFLSLIGSRMAPDALALRAMEAYRKSTGLPLRTLYLSENVRIGDEKTAIRTQMDVQSSLLSEYGYGIQENDCIFTDLDMSGKISASDEEVPPDDIEDGNKLKSILGSCAVVQTAPLRPDERARRQRVDARIDRWALRCPEAYSSRGFWSNQYPKARMYFFDGTDSQIAELDNGKLIADYWGNILTLEDENGTPLITECPPKPSR